MMVLQQYNRFSAALTISFHNMLGLRICQVMQQFDIYLTDDAATLSILYTVTYYSVLNIGVVCIYTQLTSSVCIIAAPCISNTELSRTEYLLVLGNNIIARISCCLLMRNHVVSLHIPPIYISNT